MTLNSTGAIPVSSGVFSDGSIAYALSDVGCSGSESSILECSVAVFNSTTDTACGVFDNVAVVCQGQLYWTHIAFV